MEENDRLEGEWTDERWTGGLTRRGALGLVGAVGFGVVPGVAGAKLERASSSDIVIVPNFVVDGSGNPAPFADPTTEIFDANEPGGPKAIVAPDGHHLTWGEFDDAEGRISVKCVRKGTHVAMHLDGLIPKGLYTIWVVVFASPGFDGTFANLIGAAPLGRNDGSQNAFRASRSGRGSVVAIDRPDGLTMAGPKFDPAYVTGACLLTDEFEVHFVGAYHYDDQTHGPVVGNDAIEQFGFIFGGP